MTFGLARAKFGGARRGPVVDMRTRAKKQAIVITCRKNVFPHVREHLFAHFGGPYVGSFEMSTRGDQTFDVPGFVAEEKIQKALVNEHHATQNFDGLVRRFCDSRAVIGGLVGKTPWGTLFELSFLALNPTAALGMKGLYRVSVGYSTMRHRLGSITTMQDILHYARPVVGKLVRQGGFLFFRGKKILLPGSRIEDIEDVSLTETAQVMAALQEAVQLEVLESATLVRPFVWDGSSLEIKTVGMHLDNPWRPSFGVRLTFTVPGRLHNTMREHLEDDFASAINTLSV